MGLPVLHRSSSCMHAVATTPAELQGAFFARFPCNDSLPRKDGGSASALRFSRPARRSLALRPAYSPSHMMTLYTGGFSRFIASTAAPIATGWSENRRAGFAPAGKPCLCTAHTIEHAKLPAACRKARAGFLAGELSPYRQVPWPPGTARSASGACSS